MFIIGKKVVPARGTIRLCKLLIFKHFTKSCFLYPQNLVTFGPFFFQAEEPKRPINWNLRNWAKEYLSAITRIYFSLVDCPNNINKYSNIEGCL